jgi:hypothetical protein
MDTNYEKETTIYEGDLNDLGYGTLIKLRQEILSFIKEKGLTVSQAKELLESTLKKLSDCSVVISVADYEKLNNTVDQSNINSSDVVVDYKNEKNKSNSLPSDNVEQGYKDSGLETISKELEKLTEAFNNLLMYGVRTV